jgi:fumarate hydratase class II
MMDMRKETDSLGEVDVPADKLWGAQTQRSLEHFSIGKDLIPREMITAYAILKKAAANANHAGKRLDDQHHKLIVQVCDEILANQHHDMFPLHVWMTGSGTQFNMNVNEVISNRCCQIVGTPLGSKTPVHPNDHVNMAQSSNDSFPCTMCIASAVNVKQRLIPAINAIAGAYAKHLPVFHLTGMPNMPTQAGRAVVHQTLGTGEFDTFRKTAEPVDRVPKRSTARSRLQRFAAS